MNRDFVYKEPLVLVYGFVKTDVAPGNVDMGEVELKAKEILSSQELQDFLCDLDFSTPCESYHRSRKFWPPGFDLSAQLFQYLVVKLGLGKWVGEEKETPE